MVQFVFEWYDLYHYDLGLLRGPHFLAYLPIYKSPYIFHEANNHFPKGIMHESGLV